MKIPLLLCFAAGFSATARAVESPVPAQRTAARYVAMSDASPFALATVAAAPTAPGASFAADWYISGIARLGDTDFVTVKSRDAALQFSLFGQEPDRDRGVAVASVNWSDTLGKTTVILKKGTETAKLEFNEMEMRAPVAVAQPGNPGNPGNPGSPKGRPPGFNGGRPPFPAVTPVTANQQFPPGTPGADQVRRRQRVIPVPR